MKRLNTLTRNLWLLVAAFSLCGLSEAWAQGAVPGAPLNFQVAVTLVNEADPGEGINFNFSWEANPDGGVADGYRLYGSAIDVYTGQMGDYAVLADVVETEVALSLEQIASTLDIGDARPIDFLVRAYNDAGESEAGRPGYDGGDGHGFPDFPGDENDMPDFPDDEFRAFFERLNELIEETLNGERRQLTEEEQEAIMEQLREEFGDVPFDPFGEFPGGEFPGHDGEDIAQRIHEIITEVVGEEVPCEDLCSLSKEQREEINERLREEFGDECPPMIICPDDEIDFPGGEDDEIVRFITRLQELIEEALDGNENGELSDEQKEEILNKLKEEFGDELPFDPFEEPEYEEDELTMRLEELLREAGGDDWDGDICALSQEDRESIYNTMLEEFGVELPFLLYCDEGPGWEEEEEWPEDGPSREELEQLQKRINEIAIEVLGEDFEGEPTQEQLEEIFRRLREEFPDLFDEDDCYWDEEAEALVHDPEGAADRVISGVGEGSAAVAIAAYPNPAVNSLRVEFDAVPGSASLVLSNSAGEQVFVQSVQTQSGGNILTIDVRSLPSGTYFLNIAVAGQLSQTAPVIITR